MTDFYQNNRALTERYRQELQKKIAALIHPAEFAGPGTPDPQKFYLEYKNRIVAIADEETGKHQEELLSSENCHLLLLKQTALVDTLIQASLRTAVWFHNRMDNTNLRETDVPVAIVARGGYGREEMYFRSDVDIQIVSKATTDETGQAATRKIVGHFEYLFIFQDIFPTASSACYSESETLTQDVLSQKISDFFSLLEHRFVAGDRSVYEEFKDSVKKAALAHQEVILNHCMKHKTCYEVHNTVFQQEPNIKEELRRLYWALFLVRFRKGLETTNQFELLYELYEKKILSAPAFKNMQGALNFLSKVRFFLHCHQKGAHRDVLSYEVRDKIAESMGYDLKTFYEHYFHRAAYPLKRYSRNLYWESMTLETKKVKNLSKYFALNADDQIISDKNPETLFLENPQSVFKLFAWVAEKNYFLSYQITRSIEDQADKMCPIFMDAEEQKEVQSYFERIINGKYFAKALRLLREFGLLGNYYIPEFKNIYGLLQDIYVHQFPTDMHTLSALDELNKLELKKDADPFLVELYHSLKDKTTLKLAVLLHDIGKGAKTKDQNEELLGARMVRTILPSLGYTDKPQRTDDVAFLVEKHLIIRDLMFLDPEEDDTYDMVWDLVDNNAERLTMLVLLTFADRGGTKMKMTSLQINELKLFYQYTLHHKKRENVPTPVKLDFLKMVRLPRELQTRLGIYNEFIQSGDPFLAEFLFKPGQPADLIVCAKDQKGLLMNIATVLVFNQLQIVEANIQTSGNNVFDVF
ncbi:MAG: HD domain-containing protein, partial [Nitrospinaceae bacterium]